MGGSIGSCFCSALLSDPTSRWATPWRSATLHLHQVGGRLSLPSCHTCSAHLFSLTAPRSVEFGHFLSPRKRTSPAAFWLGARIKPRAELAQPWGQRSFSTPLARPVFWGGRQNCSSNARPGLVANLRKNICRPPQKTVRAGLSGDDLLSQGFASSALGSILPPSQKAARLARCKRAKARFSGLLEPRL
jgi:hypothetical protein